MFFHQHYCCLMIAEHFRNREKQSSSPHKNERKTLKIRLKKKDFSYTLPTRQLQQNSGLWFRNHVTILFLLVLPRMTMTTVMADILKCRLDNVARTFYELNCRAARLLFRSMGWLICLFALLFMLSFFPLAFIFRKMFVLYNVFFQINHFIYLFLKYWIYLFKISYPELDWIKVFFFKLIISIICFENIVSFYFKF